MPQIWIEPLFSSILALTLGMARVYPCLLLVPVFGFRDLKGMLRYAIVITIALVVTPGIKLSIAASAPSAAELVFLFFKEAVLGMMLGLLLGMPFWLFESVGAMLDNQRGALSGGQLNPALGPDATPTGHMLKQLLIFLMIVGGGFLSMLEIIWNSYQLWTPTLWFPQPAADGLDVYLDLLANTFRNFVLYAAPLVAALLFIDFGMGILSLFSPQLQVFILAMPAKCLLGLGFLILYLPTLIYLSESEIDKLGAFKHTLELLFTQ
ncbi:MAG: type III secretion system export apparatus subunit SctT [Exilibacterium sp.]